MARKGKEEPVRPIIVKKIVQEAHAGHHGGAWKVAYADFVTAMMAFFLLMWLLGATNEKQRKSIADYFAPTLIKTPSESAGGYGPFGGDSIIAENNFQNGSTKTAIPRPVLDIDIGKSEKDTNRKHFKEVKIDVENELKRNSRLAKLIQNIRFTETREGLRIDMVDDADFSMFFTGTDKMTNEASQLLRAVNDAIATTPNPLIIRGHTDAAPWTRGSGGNNWKLSTSRSEATRDFLVRGGLDKRRIARIEGVADSEPYVPSSPYDPRNRRISVTLGWINNP